MLLLTLDGEEVESTFGSFTLLSDKFDLNSS